MIHLTLPARLNNPLLMSFFFEILDDYLQTGNVLILPYQKKFIPHIIEHEQ